MNVRGIKNARQKNKVNKKMDKLKRLAGNNGASLRSAYAGLMLAIASLSVAAFEQELSVNNEQIRSLGIKVQALVASSEQANTILSMRTAFAPDGEWLIKTPVPGILHSVLVNEGDSVTAGQALAVIRSANVVQTQRDFLRAASRLDMQLSISQRETLLFDAGSISKKRWRETRFNTDTVRAEYAALEAELQLIGFTAIDIDVLKRSMKISSEFNLRAPVDALVIGRSTTLGDHLEGTELLLRLGEPEKLVLMGQLSSGAAQALIEGNTIFSSYGQGQAIITFVSKVIDPVTQTIHVRAEPNSIDGLIPGQLSQWYVRPSGKVLAVPAAAVIKLEGKDALYVKTESGFEARAVTARSSSSGAWLIDSGVAVGDRVAIKGTAVLKGMSIGMGGGEE